MIIRVRFGKEGALRFIGHLDVLRTFQKIFRRAGIPMVYSNGFSPHPIMSFALPLGLGLSSEGEYLDAEIPDGTDLTALLPKLKAASSPELPVIAFRVLPEKAGNAMASVGRAAYRLSVPGEVFSPLQEAVKQLLDEERHMIEKKTKTQTVSLDLRPCICRLSMEAGEVPYLNMTLSAGSKMNIKPELVWEELLKAAGMPETLKPAEIRRMDLLTEEGRSLGEI